jgi:hypothetical protein
LRTAVDARSAFEKGYAPTNPFPVFVEVDADHFALAESGEVNGEGRSGGVVFPQVHHSNFCFGGDIRGGDEVGIFDFALEDPVLRVFDFEVGQLGVDDDTLAGKGEEGFEDIILQVGGGCFSSFRKKAGGA